MKTRIFKNQWLLTYRTPSMKTRDARVLDMISTILSDGKVHVCTKKLLMTMALNWCFQLHTQEDFYGSYIICECLKVILLLLI
ncbi:MAG: hypothetical protein U0T80_01075 [Flavobacteriaceae bacterium]